MADSKTTEEAAMMIAVAAWESQTSWDYSTDGLDAACWAFHQHMMNANPEAAKLRHAIRTALNLLRNPYDGGEYEDGEFPAVDTLRKALEASSNGE